MSKNTDRYFRKIWTHLFALIMLLAITVCAAGCGARKTKIGIGTAGLGGNYHSFGTAYAQVLMNDIEDADVHVKVTAGSGANLRMITKKDPEIDLAIIQSDVLAQMTEPDDESEQETSGVRAIAGMYTEAVQLVVRRDSGITEVADLKGKRISIGEAESGSEKNALLVLRAFGLRDGMYEMRSLDYAASVQALQDGKIDAFFCTMGTPTTAITAMSKKVPVRLVDLGGEELEQITSDYPYYVTCTISAGTYNGMDKDVQTIGVKSVLVASESLSADLVKLITQSLFDHADELQYSVTMNYKPDPAEAVRDLPIPLHEGARAWYEENGIALPEETQ